MAQDMSRRDFLKLSGAFVLTGNPAGPAPSARKTVRIPEADKIVITVIADNLADALRPHDRIARRHEVASSVLEFGLHAEHGLAYHVETEVDGRAHSFLFDFATDFQGVGKNMALLKLDLKGIEALVLSHDHFDHQAALIGLLRTNRADIPRRIPFFVGEGFFSGTYFKKPGGPAMSLLALDREEVEGLGLVEIVVVRDPAPIVPGAYSSGRIERVTDYEQIPPVFVRKSGEELVPEEFAGEQAVILNARGKGLVVLSGCAHRGIINTVRHAQKMTGIGKVHAVIGGFHLSGAGQELIRKTIADMRDIGPDYVVPAHCTGFEAVAAFAGEMPGPFILNTVGTKYRISA